MRCETCYGFGDVLIDGHGNIVRRFKDAARMVPCPECGGCGHQHCCEGSRAQPEPPEEPQP